MMACPVCGGKRIYRSRRKGIVERRLLTLIFIKPFRCKACDCRFFRSSITAQSASPFTPPAE
jgi:hypothetical protein